MKRLSAFIAIILSVIAAFTLCACAGGAPDHDTSSPSYMVERASIESKLDDFIANNKDRTSFSDAEYAAAEYLRDALISYGYDNAEIRPFSVTTDTVNKLTSANVCARYEGAGDSRKNVIIGAYYDNVYDTPYRGSPITATKAEGALANGTGVAAVLEIAEYLKKAEHKELDFDVTIVFFGASSISTQGAQKFYDSMTEAQRASTVLMIELQRLGVDHVYAYTDDRENGRDALFSGVAAKRGLDIYKPTQKSPNITTLYSLDGIPFYKWAHSGVFRTFFNEGIPTLNIVGANWETMDLTDTESEKYAPLSLTKDDTLGNLKKLYPDYSEKIAAGVTLALGALFEDGFIATMESDRNNFPDTTVFIKGWVWALIALGVAALAGGIMWLVSMHLAKKYPLTHESGPQKNIKMAVFGMDYEDRNSDDIFIDIKDGAKGDDDIFPGIPNNDDTPGTIKIIPLARIIEEAQRAAEAEKKKEQKEDNDDKNDKTDDGEEK